MESEDGPSDQPGLKRAESVAVPIPEEIREIVERDNNKYWQHRFLFNKEYFEFMLELCSLWNTGDIVPLNELTKNNDYHLHGVDIASMEGRDTKNFFYMQSLPFLDRVDLRKHYKEEDIVHS